jgi:phosphatidylglycerophosphate synthase
MSERTNEEDEINENSIGKQGWIPDEHLQNLVSYYKYVSPQTTRCENVVMDKFWSRLVNYVPRSIAPNVITVVGLICVFLPWLLMFFEDYTMTQQVATWKYFLFAILIFVYQTLDALDGKQARRTGTSSPLGELMDHGCDAVACLLIGLMYCHVFSFGADFRTLVGILFHIGIFVMFMLEKRFTFLLRTALGEFGTIEAHYLYMVVLCLRGVVGPQLVEADIGFISSIIQFKFNVQNIMFVMSFISLIGGTILTAITGYQAAKISEETSQFFKYFITVMSSYVCMLVILPFTKVFYLIPVTCIFVVGFSLIKICWKFIIAGTMKFHFNPFTYDHLISVVACFLSFFLQFWNHELTVFIMIVAFLLSLISVIRFAETTVVQIADHLKIKVFSISPKELLIEASDAENENENENENEK